MSISITNTNNAGNNVIILDGEVSFTLPGSISKHLVTIKNIGDTPTTIYATDGELIDGLPYYDLQASSLIDMIKGDTGFIIIGHFDSLIPSGAGGFTTLSVGGLISNPGGIKRNTADFTKANTTLTTVTGLSINLAASTAYRFRVFASMFANGAGNFKMGMDYTGSITSGSHTIITTTESATYSYKFIGSTVTDTHVITPGTDIIQVQIEGIIVTNTAGALEFQFAEHTEDAEVSFVFANSTLEAIAL